MVYKTSGYLVTATQTADGSATELTTTATIPSNTSIDVTVKQDESGGTTADNTETISIGDGSNTYSLNNFSYAENSTYWLRVDLSTTDDASTPSLDAATVTIQNTTVPTAPSNLSASEDASRNVDLSWTDNSNGTGQEDEFRIYRAQSSGSTTADYTQIATVGTDVTTYEDSTVDDEQRYYYRATAYNSAGESSVSNEDDVRVTLPRPTDLSTSKIALGGADASMQDNASDKNGYRFYTKPDGHLAVSSNDQVDTTIASLPISQGDVTIAFRGTISDTSVQNNLVRVANSSNADQRVVPYYSGSELVVYRYNGTNITTGVSLSDGEEFTIVYVERGGTAYVYVNGAQEGSDSPVSYSLDAFGYASGANHAGELHSFVLASTGWASSEVSDFEAGNPGLNPEIYYEFADGSGSAVTDISWNGNDNSISGSGYTWHGGGSWSQNGSDLPEQYALEVDDQNYVTASTTSTVASVLNSHQFTISWWFDPKNALNADSWDDFWYWRLDSGRFRFEEYGSESDRATVYWDTTNGTAKLGDVYPTGPVHLTLVVDGDNSTLYADGSQVDTQTPTSSELNSAVSSNEFGIGRGNDDTVGMDDLRLIDGVLTQQEVKDVMNGQMDGREVVQWTFNSPGASTISDTQNEMDGSVSGSPTWVAPMAPVTHSLTGLTEAETYVARGSTYSSSAEVFDN